MTAAIYLVFTAILLVLVLITAAGKAMMFKKAGEKPWKAFIPFYGGYTLYRLTWKNLLYFVRLWLIALSNIADPKTSGIPAQAVALVLAVAAIAISVISALKTARSFGKGIGFGIGLWLLPPVYCLISGFSREITYLGRWDRKQQAYTAPEKPADLKGNIGKTINGAKEFFKKGH